MDGDCAFGVVHGCGEVDMFSCACYYSGKAFEKKTKTGAIPPVGETKSRIWGHRVVSGSLKLWRGGSEILVTL